MTEKELVEIIRNTYPAPSFATLAQVRNQTGFSAGTIRTADALTLSLFPSRGLFLAGFEIKVSRSDWLKELNSPSKAESIQKYCDYWWIVTDKEGIVDLAELPENWGLAVANRTRLKTIKRAPKLIHATLDIEMLCGILRNVTENFIDRREIERKLRENYQNGKEMAESNIKYDLEKLAKLQDTIRIFEEKSGVKINSWYHSAENIGEAVKLVLNGHHLRERENIKALRKDTLRIIERIDEVLKPEEIQN